MIVRFIFLSFFCRFFFFKQKTAYEMRISDWSSDVCSSDLIHQLRGDRPPSLDPMMALVAADMNEVNSAILDRMQSEVPLIPELAGHLIAGGGKRMRPMLTLACGKQIGRASCRERVCQYV